MKPCALLVLSITVAMLAALVWSYFDRERLETQLAQARQHVAELEAIIGKQNAAITLLAANANAAEASAAAAARRALLEGGKRKMELAPGHAALNQWLQETFGHGR